MTSESEAFISHCLLFKTQSAMNILHRVPPQNLAQMKFFPQMCEKSSDHHYSAKKFRAHISFLASVPHLPKNGLCSTGDTPLCHFIRMCKNTEEDLSFIEYFISIQDVSLSAKNHSGGTPFMLALSMKKYSIAEAMLASGKFLDVSTRCYTKVFLHSSFRTAGMTNSCRNALEYLAAIETSLAPSTKTSCSRLIARISRVVEMLGKDDPADPEPRRRAAREMRRISMRRSPEADLLALLLFHSDGIIELDNRCRKEDPGLYAFFVVSAGLSLELQSFMCSGVFGVDNELVFLEERMQAMQSLACVLRNGDCGLSQAKRKLKSLGKVD